MSKEKYFEPFIQKHGKLLTIVNQTSNDVVDKILQDNFLKQITDDKDIPDMKEDDDKTLNETA